MAGKKKTTKKKVTPAKKAAKKAVPTGQAELGFAAPPPTTTAKAEGEKSDRPNSFSPVARRIRTGTINVNGGNFYGADAPFGGYKQSGLGREMGPEGFEEYLETKTIAIGA